MKICASPDCVKAIVGGRRDRIYCDKRCQWTADHRKQGFRPRTEYIQSVKNDNRVNGRLLSPGWTAERLSSLNYAQGGLCYLCGESNFSKGIDKSLAADHSHKDDTPRGLLCTSCNMNLPVDIDSLKTMIAYLQLFE